MTAGQVRVEIDKDVCMSAEYCLHTAAEVFTVDTQGVVALVGATEELVHEVPGALRERVITAAQQCPSGAISWKVLASD